MEGAEAEEFGEFLDSWARAWQQEFERFSSAEDARLFRVAERARQFAENGLSSYHDAMEAKIQEGDARAKQLGRVAGEVLEAQQAHAVQELRHEAAEGRRQVSHGAMQSADDLVRSVEEDVAARREAREAKRREEKRAREAAAEARRRQRQAEQQGAGEAGAAGAGAPPGGGGARSRGTSEPPRYTRRPGAHAAAAAAAAAEAAAERPPPRLSTFAAYDAAWGHFEQRVAAALERGGFLRIDDIPWPTLLPSISGVCAGDASEVQKEKLRSAVLRWHPDKWGKVLGLIHEDHRARVMEGVKGVTQRIIEERKRFGRRAR